MIALGNCGGALLRIELDDQLLLDGGVDDLASRHRVDEDPHPVADDLDPRRHRPRAGRGPRDGAPGELGPGRPGHWQFDLAGYCVRRLEGAAEVEVLDADTLADEARFYSHRRRTLAGGGPIGHQISAVVLAAEG